MSKDDIVTQLRDEAEVWPSPSLYSKAAAEIERLRAAAKAVLSALDKTPVQNMTLEVHDRREALRAISEGRLRLASLLFIACAGGNVFTAALRSDYRALPKIPARAKERA